MQRADACFHWRAGSGERGDVVRLTLIPYVNKERERLEKIHSDDWC